MWAYRPRCEHAHAKYCSSSVNDRFNVILQFNNRRKYTCDEEAVEQIDYYYEIGRSGHNV